MDLWLGSMACAMAVMSAIALYAGSPHCLWAPQRRPRVARLTGIALALLSLATWTAVAGLAIGLCTMLACWMLSLMALPYLALLSTNRRAASEDNLDVG